MKSIRQALDKALGLLGANSRRLSTKTSQRKSATGELPLLKTTSSKTATSDTAAQEIRSEQELAQYALLPELLDTRVQGERGWLKCLRGLDPWQSISRLKQEELPLASKSTILLSRKLFEFVSHLAQDYNELSRPVIGLTAPSEVSEKVKVVRVPGAAEVTETVVYTRWRVSTSTWSLSCRSKPGMLEIFLLPAQDIMALSRAEAQFRLKLRLELYRVAEQQVWIKDAMPIGTEELRSLLKAFFQELVTATQDLEQPVQTNLENIEDARLARSLEQLRIERENLAQKVVIQQEEIQKRIARDLHDAVISDVMSLKRSISSGQSSSYQDLSGSLDRVVRKLREICYDLSPRDLSDWGLATVVEDMLDQISQRTGIDCRLECEQDLPTLPSAVLLHIYRIIQESLNNAEKYAEPSQVVVSIGMESGKFAITVVDDGKGFDLSATEKSSRSGGYGLGSLKERADLIRCFYPTKLYLSSMPGKGSTVRLEIDI